MTGYVLSPRELGEYLSRLGFAETPCRDFATIEALVQAHVRAIAFENIEVQLGAKPTTDVRAAFEKLVERQRGGWCYEHNGVLGAALAAIGFDVTRLSGGVMRQVRGDEAMASHLCLLVDGKWLVDAGFGSWLEVPLPLEQGQWAQPPFTVDLGRTDDGLWRVSIALGESAMSYDFHAVPADEDELSRLCTWQASDPTSIFVQNLTAQRRDGTRFLGLRGKVLSIATGDGETQRELGSADELVACLRDTFLLDVPEAAELWPVICARHDALFSPQTLPTT